MQKASTAPVSSTSDHKQVGIVVGVIGICVSLFLAATVIGLSFYYASFYAAR